MTIDEEIPVCESSSNVNLNAEGGNNVIGI